MDPTSCSTWHYIDSRSIAETYDDYFRDSALFRFDTEVLRRHIREPGPLLDLGSGTGRHVAAFARQGFPVTGLDLSPRMLAINRGKLEREGLTATLHNRCICDLGGFSQNSFRYAICMFSTIGLIQGKANRKRFVQGVHRVLQPDGLFAVHTHNRWYNLRHGPGRQWLLRNFLGALLRRCELGDKTMESYRGLSGQYIHIFSIWELWRLIRQAGFDIHETVYLNATRDRALPTMPGRAALANGFIVIARAS